MAYLLFSILFLVIGLQLWRNRSNIGLKEMNVGARLFQSKQYAEAEAHFQQLLTKRLPPGVEADTRRRLADTLDVLGKSGDAADERERIESIIAQSPLDARAQEAQGDLLKRKHQYKEACEAYTRALEKTPSASRTKRALIMAKLAIANYEIGRPAETVTWAEISLSSRPQPRIRHSMERMSAVGYADQGILDKAEQHYREALRLSELSGIPKEIAQDLSGLANIQQKRGQFAEAIAACRKARQIAVDPSGIGFSTEAECLREMGRFDEARAMMEQRRLAPGFDQPHIKRRMQALNALGSAWIEVRANQPDAALAFLEQARPIFEAKSEASTTWPPAPQKGDDKLLLWCDATKTLALAQRGETEGARRLRESVLSRLASFDQDRATQLPVYAYAARASFTLGDLAECREFYRCYLACQPNPVGLPAAYYWLGETHLRLAEAETARDFFRQAVAVGIDSLEARRAQARLTELGG